MGDITEATSTNQQDQRSEIPPEITIESSGDESVIELSEEQPTIAEKTKKTGDLPVTKEKVELSDYSDDDILNIELPPIEELEKIQKEMNRKCIVHRVESSDTEEEEVVFQVPKRFCVCHDMIGNALHCAIKDIEDESEPCTKNEKNGEVKMEDDDTPPSKKMKFSHD